LKKKGIKGKKNRSACMIPDSGYIESRRATATKVWNQGKKEKQDFGRMAAVESKNWNQEQPKELKVKCSSWNWTQVCMIVKV